MIRTKRILALMLVIAALLFCVACNGEASESESSSDVQGSEGESESGTEKGTSKSTKKTSTGNTDKILKSDLPNYKFVVGKDATKSILRAAQGVSRIAKEKWETDGDVQTDDYLSAEDATLEVLVGKTNRPESVKFIASLKEGEGGYAVLGSKLVIAGYSDNETISALNLFYTSIMLPLGVTRETYITSERNFKEDLSGHISIMSFNVFVGIASDSAKSSNAMKIIKAYNPDIFGVQEASAEWKSRLSLEFKDEYEIIGEPRGDSSGEATLIFVRKSKFTVESFGTKWLTSTPDTVSKVSGSLCNRIMTYAVLGTKDGNVINFVNTHLDHGDESVRVAQAGYLGQILESELDTEYPTFITGDFNMTPSSSAYSKMTGLGYKPSYELADKNYSKDKSTFSGGGIIDYCFISNNSDVETLLYRVCDEGLYGENSDHYALYTIVKC